MRSHYNKAVSQRFENEHGDVSRAESFSAELYINVFTLCNLGFVFLKNHM